MNTTKKFNVSFGVHLRLVAFDWKPEFTWKWKFVKEQLCWTGLCSGMHLEKHHLQLTFLTWSMPLFEAKQTSSSGDLSAYRKMLFYFKRIACLKWIPSSLAISGMTSLWDVTSTRIHRTDWKTENNWSLVWHLPCSFGGRWKCCKLWLRRFSQVQL